MKKRTIIIIVIVVLALVGGYFGYQQYLKTQAAASSAYQTETVKRGDLTALVGATGVVRANQSTLLNWQTSGRIAAIHADIGDMVAQDQVLSELALDSLSQSVILAKADLVSARRTLDNLLNSEAARAQAEVNLANATQALEDAREKRTKKDYARSSKGTLDQAQANYILAQEAYETALDNYTAVAHLPEDDPGRAAMLSRLGAAEQDRDRALANLNWLLGKPDATELAQADAQVSLAEANLKDAQREWERLKDGPDPEDVAAARARVEAIEATLSQTRLEAPFAGTVTDSKLHVGDQVSMGTQAFRIDDLSHLLVDVEISEVDINRVQVEQDAELTFDAIQGKTYNGKVVKVGRVGNSSQGVVNFTVTVELTDADKDVKPGMTAAVNVVVEKIENVLLVPNRAVRQREGKKVVYVLKDNMPEIVDIEVGSSSEVSTQVLSGVEEGAVVILNPPAEIRFGPPSGGAGRTMR